MKILTLIWEIIQQNVKHKYREMYWQIVFLKQQIYLNWIWAHGQRHIANLKYDLKKEQLKRCFRELLPEVQSKQKTPLCTPNITLEINLKENFVKAITARMKNILKRHTFLIVHKDIHREHLTKVNENTEYVLSTIRNAHPQKIQTYR